MNFILNFWIISCTINSNKLIKVPAILPKMPSEIRTSTSSTLIYFLFMVIDAEISQIGNYSISLLPRQILSPFAFVFFNVKFFL